MPQLLHLDGRPQTWDELHARLAEYYRPKPTRLQQRLLDVMRAVGESGEWFDEYALSYHSGWGLTAIRSAMPKLEEMGLVEYEREGRDNYWRLPE